MPQINNINNNAMHPEASRLPDRIDTTLSRQSSAECWNHEFMQPENQHCGKPNQSLQESETPSDDINFIRYLKSLLPRMPLKYLHYLSPKKRPQQHVLRSKMRIWHFRRNPFALKVNPKQLNASNVIFEGSAAEAPKEYRYASSSAGSFNVCCSHLIVATTEQTIVHWQTAATLAIVTACSSRVQTARRIQRMEFSDPRPEPGPAVSPPKRQGNRRQPNSHVTVSLGGDGQVEVQPLLTVQLPLPSSSSTRIRGHHGINDRLAQKFNRGTQLEIRISDAAATPSAMATVFDSSLHVGNACTVEMPIDSSSDVGVVNGANVSNRSSPGVFTGRDTKSDGSRSSGGSSSRFSCKPSLSNHEATLRQSDRASVAMTASGAASVKQRRCVELSAEPLVEEIAASYRTSGMVSSVDAAPSTYASTVAAVADEVAIRCSGRCQRLRAIKAARMLSRATITCLN